MHRGLHSECVRRGCGLGSFKVRMNGARIGFAQSLIKLGGGGRVPSESFAFFLLHVDIAELYWVRLA